MSFFTLQEIWSWLNEIPDPEIPVISIVELGVVRKIDYEGELLKVSITPTYSGCPAMKMIETEIEKVLREKKVGHFHIETLISPVWTTEWIGAEAREKLRAYGIAPPVEETHSKKALLLGIEPEITCPRCGSSDTQMKSYFGSTPCKSLYQCRQCLEPFDYFKCL